MKKIGRHLSFLFVSVILFRILPLMAYANAPGPALDGSFTTNYAAIVALGIISLLGIGLTCGIEWLVAKYFALQKEYGKQIILTNIITQIAMRVIQLILPVLLPIGMSWVIWYAICVFVLEICVIISEFLIYKKIMQNVAPKYICWFTVAANVASALGGILLLVILL